MGADKVIGVAVSSISKIGNTPIGNISSIGGQPVSSFTNTYSFEFDGVDEYVDTDLTVPASLLGNFSVSFWINMSPVSGGTYLKKHPVSVSTSVTALDQTVHVRAWNTQYLIRQVGSLSGGGVGTTDLSDNNWHHIAYTYTYDAGTTYYTVNIYVDGNATPEVISVMRTTGGYATQGLYKIGALGSYTTKAVVATSYFPGLIDEVSAWGSVLSTGDIATLAGGPNNLNTVLSSTPLGWWRMGDDASWDGSDWTLTDQGSGGNDGTSDNMEEDSRTTDVPT